MAIGKFDKVVVFKTDTPSDLGAGAEDNYTTLLTTRGRLERNGGGRSGAFADITGTESWTLWVRKQTALVNALSIAMKVEIEGYLYAVTGWEDIEERHFYYKFSLNKEVTGPSILS
jgi:hypothetical protein